LEKSNGIERSPILERHRHVLARHDHSDQDHGQRQNRRQAAVSNQLIYLNSALGGAAGSGGSDGLGQGGGIYVASGVTVTLKKSKIVGNFGSTGIDNIFGTVIYL
jgi:hypothetical protein